MSNFGRLVGFFLLWWYSGVLSFFLEFGALIACLHTIYKLYGQNFHDKTAEYENVDTSDVVFITGCDSGIGQAVADKLASKFTVVASVLDTKSPSSVALQNAGVILVHMDYNRRETVDAAVKELTGILNGKRLYGVINNAGVCVMGEFDWFCFDQIENIVNVNLLGNMYLTKQLMDRVIDDRSRIINVTSVNGKVASTGLSVYCATKFTLEGFTDSLKYELEKYGVKVITVRPGDYTALTPIMKSQDAHKAKMWNQMEPARQSRYASYFDAFNKMVTSNRGRYSADSFDSIRAVFEDALLSKNPQDAYNEGGTLFILINSILMALPTRATGMILNLLFDRGTRKYMFK